MVIVYLIKFLIFKSIQKENSFIKTNGNIIKIIFKFLLGIFNVDYTISKLFKNKIKVDSKSEKNVKTPLSLFIVRSNYVNLLFSVILAIALCIVCWKFKNLKEICLIIIGVRLFFRTMEINFSFVCDIIDERNQSLLKVNERIKLAFLSLIEEAILFAITYYCMCSIDLFTAIYGGLHSFILSVPNIGDSLECCMFKIVSVYQAICSVVLITISFAGYISGLKNKSIENNNKEENIDDEIK